MIAITTGLQSIRRQHYYLGTDHDNYYHDVKEGYINVGSHGSFNRGERKYILNQLSDQLILNGLLALQGHRCSRSRRKMFLLRGFPSCTTKSHVNVSLLWILSRMDYNNDPDALIWLCLHTTMMPSYLPWHPSPALTYPEVGRISTASHNFRSISMPLAFHWFSEFQVNNHGVGRYPDVHPFRTTGRHNIE